MTLLAHFDDIFMPPSINQCYATIGSRRVAAVKLRKYKACMALWGTKNRKSLIEVFRWIKANKNPRISLEFCFYFQKRNINRIDVSNRIKAIEDQICKFIGLDDRYVFKVSAEKRIAAKESVSLRIFFYEADCDTGRDGQLVDG